MYNIYSSRKEFKPNHFIRVTNPTWRASSRKKLSIPYDKFLYSLVTTTLYLEIVKHELGRARVSPLLLLLPCWSVRRGRRRLFKTPLNTPRPRSKRVHNDSHPLAQRLLFFRPKHCRGLADRRAARHGGPNRERRAGRVDGERRQGGPVGGRQGGPMAGQRPRRWSAVRGGKVEKGCEHTASGRQWRRVDCGGGSAAGVARGVGARRAVLAGTAAGQAGRCCGRSCTCSAANPGKAPKSIT